MLSSAAGFFVCGRRPLLPRWLRSRRKDAGVRYVATGKLGAADVAQLRDMDIEQVIDLTLDAETPEFNEAGATQAHVDMFLS